MELALYLVYLVILGIALRHSSQAGRSGSSLAASLGLTLTPVLITAGIGWWSADRASETRIRLLATRFFPPAAADPKRAQAAVTVPVSGSRDIAGVSAPGLPDPFISIDFDGSEDTPVAKVRYAVSADGTGPAGLVAIPHENSSLRIVGEVPLAKGDRIITSTGGGAREIEIESKRSVRCGGALLDLPTSNKLPLFDRYVGSRFREVEARVFPIRAILDEANARASTPADQQDSVPFASFLFHKPTRMGLRGELYLALLDPAIQVRRADGSVAVYQSEHRITEFNGNGALPVHFMSLGKKSTALERSSPPGALEPRWVAYLGIRRQLSGTLSWEADPAAAVFHFQTPEVLNVTRRAAQSLASGQQSARGQLFNRVHLTLVADTTVPKSLSFNRLPLPFRVSGHAVLESKGDQFQVIGPAGQMAARFGQPFWLGGRAQALVQVDLLRPEAAIPFGCGALAILCACALAVGSYTALFELVFGGVECLLCIRLLLGFQVFNKYPSDYKSYGLALFAFAYVSLGLLIVQPDAGKSRLWRALIAGYGFVTGVLAFAVFDGRVALWTGILSGITALGGILPTTGAVSLAKGLWRSRAPRSGGGPVFFQALGYCVAPAAFLVICRAVLAFNGIRERFPGPPPIAISTAYTALAIVAFTILGAFWVRRQFRPAWMFLLCWALFITLTFGVAGFVASDLGLLISALPMLAYLLEYTGDRIGHNTTATMATGAVLLALFGLSVFVNLRGSSGDGFSAVDRNILRVVAAFRPDRLPEQGDLASENLAIMQGAMGAYLNEAGGKGYLGADIHPVIRATALREHVPSVLVAGDFGKTGLTCLGLLYVAIAFAWSFVGLPRFQATAGARAMLGRMAILTFTTASVYMILANAGLTFFTGKNTYLLGLDSIGDVLESTILLAMFAYSAQEGAHAPVSQAASAAVAGS